MIVWLLAISFTELVTHKVLIFQAQEKIEANWEISVDGNIVEGSVDLNEYKISFDKESKTVILTTKDKQYTYFYPIFFKQ